jgi:hypothetical protein
MDALTLEFSAKSFAEAGQIRPSGAMT